MKINWLYIKLVLLLLVISGLYAFSNARNAAKDIRAFKVDFVGNQNVYLTETAVNKLLIQKYGSPKNVTKEKLVLNKIEKDLEAHKMVKSVQVYLTIDGELTSKITQRKPIARIEGAARYYLDDEGKKMPFSRYHSARVPIITGNINDVCLEKVYAIMLEVQRDDFFKKSVIGVHVINYKQYQIRLRRNDFVVNIGGVENLKKKFSNFKAFYVKASMDKTLEKYAAVSLEFNNQVVCTKI